MKKDIGQLINEATPEELAPLWEGLEESLLDAPTRERICAGALEKAGIKRRAHTYRWRRIAAAAACLVLVIAAGFGTRAYAAEAREYRAAVTFFRENDLSLEGLTRQEIKEVYRDISTESFTYGKTAEVIDRSLEAKNIRGFELDLGDPDPDELEALWNYGVWSGRDETHPLYRPEGSDLRYESVVDTVGNDGTLQSSCVSQFDHDDLQWTTYLRELEVLGQIPLSDGVVVWGVRPPSYWEKGLLVRSDERAAGLARISSSGKVLWQVWLEGAALPCETALAAAEDGNGGFIVLTRAYDKNQEESTCYLVTVNADGQITERVQVQGEIPFTIRGHMAVLPDECLLCGEFAREANSITRVKKDGTAVETRVFSENGVTYHFSDMISDGEHVWLSGYSIAFDTDSNRGLIRAVKDRLAETGAGNMDRSELTELARQYYGAVLLVCGDTGSEMETVYSVKGSAGRGLEFGSDGSLIWTVERIESAEYYRAGELIPDHDTVLSGTHVFRYTFGTDGGLSREDTGEFSIFGPPETYIPGES